MEDAEVRRIEALMRRSERRGAIVERKRIMDLFGEVGRELMANGRDVAAYGGEERVEGRARLMAGMCVADVAQILFTEIRSEEFHKRADAILRDMREAIGEERWEGIKKESEEYLKMEEDMRDRVEVGDIVSESVLEEAELYDVVEQLVQMGTAPDDTMPTLSIMSKDGDYAGDASDMRKFFDKHGIAPELREEDANVCTIGWSEKKQKWFGWSHRATSSYGIGDKSFDGRHEIQTLEQAKVSASAFAEDVS